ncbi:acid phosphatase [Chromobacterium violaceum]|uniref:phospholipase C n=1 Tax=Chromobacterium violaceum TaxID=536 RepID=A0AAX2MDC9_CHRVL|nr:acid phosphatase [Chromobacterium violaceum]OLZ76657.1 acid phosphatase [Chromobacterium violaceum]STB70035.1 Non-hemolytic phospholipase C precursor [Chromobacterium violaceum]SUX34566.1 Non-hemolytic phospholipase C precursor [Chromobacterium violaceum]
MSEYDTPETVPETAPQDPSRRRLFEGLAAIGAATVLPAVASEAADAAPAARGSLDDKLRHHVKNVVVIYLENRSFNNLYGNFPGVRYPLSKAPAEACVQLDRDGARLKSLPKIWGGMVQRGQTVGGKYYLIEEDKIQNLPNGPFPLKDTDGEPLPEGVITRDLWHLFYQNQMQINGGRNDQFVAWADSGALVMGYYNETAKNLNQWKIAQQYTLCDNFFMAAFGGSYLNHQFLISARTPEYFNAKDTAAAKKIAVLEDGPKGYRLKVKTPTSAMDGPPQFVNNGAITPDGYAVNTMAPPFQPSYVKPAEGGDKRYADPADANTLPPQTYDTIGDLLSRKGVSWAWYGGSWQAALDGKGGPDTPNFQYHHQPFNYFKNFAPGTQARAEHLRDGGLGDSPISNRFIADAVAGKLPAVAFYKPQGNLNMHAGYSDVESGDRHVANVLQHLMSGPQWKNMVVVITHDENGGWWDHVAPPKGDRWGPGSRIPAIVVSPFAKKGHVDHTFYDTTSIIRFISRLHGLPELEGVKVRNQAFRERGAQPPGDLTGALQF